MKTETRQERQMARYIARVVALGFSDRQMDAVFVALADDGPEAADRQILRFIRGSQKHRV